MLLCWCVGRLCLGVSQVVSTCDRLWLTNEIWIGLLAVFMT